jgi:putative ATP-dependent endonuclease of OLD family
MLGISVSSVGGTNFTPYVKMLGAQGLNIPHVILTDRDPHDLGPPRVRRRLIDLLRLVEHGVNYDPMDADAVIARAASFGYFVNTNTLEPELFVSGLAEEMQSVIEKELSLGAEIRERLQEWVDDPDELDEDDLIALVERIGKGRFAQALAPRVSIDDCPDYIRNALEHIRDAVA